MTWMLLVLLMNFGWAEPNQSVPEDQFTSYVESFIKDSDGKFDRDYFDKYVRISFQENLAKHIDSNDAIGVSWVTFYAPFEIQIDTQWWKFGNSNDRWQLMYHEFGHMVCLLDHPPEASVEGLFRIFDSVSIKYVHGPFLDDGCPKTLMYPYAVSSVCVTLHRDYYTKELFKGCRKNIPLNEIGKDL